MIKSSIYILVTQITAILHIFIPDEQRSHPFLFIYSLMLLFVYLWGTWEKLCKMFSDVNTCSYFTKVCFCLRLSGWRCHIYVSSRRLVGWSFVSETSQGNTALTLFLREMVFVTEIKKNCSRHPWPRCPLPTAVIDKSSISWEQVISCHTVIHFDVDYFDLTYKLLSLSTRLWPCQHDYDPDLYHRDQATHCRHC